jgi:hypothetical protein
MLATGNSEGVASGGDDSSQNGGSDLSDDDRGAPDGAGENDGDESPYAFAVNSTLSMIAIGGAEHGGHQQTSAGEAIVSSGSESTGGEHDDEDTGDDIGLSYKTWLKTEKTESFEKVTQACLEEGKIGKYVLLQLCTLLLSAQWHVQIVFDFLSFCLSSVFVCNFSMDHDLRCARVIQICGDFNN